MNRALPKVASFCILVAVTCLAPGMTASCAPVLRFEKSTYSVHVGEAVTLNLVLDADGSTDAIEPLENGLLSFGWRVDYVPSNAAFDKSEVPREIDFFAGENGARQIIGPGQIRVKGQVAGVQPYRHSALGSVTLTNLSSSDTSYQVGTAVDRDFSTEQVFLDGMWLPIDDQLEFKPSTLSVVRRSGDFDDDGALTPVDIDLLCGHIAISSSDALFDLNQDGEISLADQSDWLTLRGVLPGDADMDGTVRFSDFLILSGSFNRSGGWAQGDFNCDRTIAFADFLLLSQFFNQSATAQSVVVQSVPEPSTALLLVGGLFLLARWHWRS